MRRLLKRHWIQDWHCLWSVPTQTPGPRSAWPCYSGPAGSEHSCWPTLKEWTILSNTTLACYHNFKKHINYHQYRFHLLSNINSLFTFLKPYCPLYYLLNSIKLEDDIVLVEGRHSFKQYLFYHLNFLLP